METELNPLLLFRVPSLDEKHDICPSSCTFSLLSYTLFDNLMSGLRNIESLM